MKSANAREGRSERKGLRAENERGIASLNNTTAISNDRCGGGEGGKRVEGDQTGERRTRQQTRQINESSAERNEIAQIRRGEETTEAKSSDERRSDSWKGG